MPNLKTTLILRALIIWGLLTALGFAAGPALTELLLPAYTWVADLLMHAFAASLSVVEPERGARQIQMLATVVRPLPLTPEITVPIGRQVPASITVLHSMVPAVIALTLVLAWPSASIRRLGIRLLLGIVATLIVLLLVNPAHLVGNLESGLQTAIAQLGGERPKPLVLRWMLLMEGGGRWLLAVVAAAICILISEAGAGRQAPEPEKAA